MQREKIKGVKKMPKFKKYEVNYFTTYHVEAENEKQAELVADKLLEEHLKKAIKSSDLCKHFVCEVQDISWKSPFIIRK